MPGKMLNRGRKLFAGNLVFFLVGAVMFPTFSWSAEIEEIIVTAQKRAQNIQEIPVAVTALNALQLSELTISDVFDLQQNIPSLAVRQNQNATTSNFSIRGVGTSGSNFGLESSVGLYVDGVYRARQNSMINEMVDMESVEVLRGPQGTLFGRNTPSGAVLMNTAAPSHEFGGYIDLDAGNFGLQSINGAVGGSLVEEVLAYRFTGFGVYRDGYVTDLNLGDDIINDRDREGGRVQLLYTPRDDLSLRLIADYSEIDEVCCAAITIKNNYLVFPRSSFTGSFTPVPTFGTDSILSLPKNNLIPGTPIAGFGADIINASQRDEDLVALTRLPHSSNTDQGFSAQLDWEVLGGEFTSISGWRDFKSDDLVDADFGSADIFSRDEHAEQTAFSQEFRFHYGNEDFDILAGLYYFEQQLDVLSNTTLGANANNFISLSVYSQAGALGQQAALAAAQGDFARAASLQAAAIQAQQIGTAIFAGLENVTLSPSNPIYPLQQLGFTGVGFPAGATGRNRMQQDHSTWAIFGQGDYRFTPELTLTLGLRYTSEEKEIDGVFSQPGASWGALVALADLVVVNPRANIAESLDDEQITGTIKLTWMPSDNMLLYASYATGYKSGGTNTDRISPAFSVLFDAETAETFEAGMKADFPERNLRVNLTLHHSTTEDYQTNAFQGTGFNLSNAGEVEAKGGELELWWNPTEGLSLTAAYVHNRAKFKGFERANCWIAYSWLTGIQDPGRAQPLNQFCDRSGGPLDTNAENSYIVGATQVFALTGDIEAYIHADYNYQDEQYMDGNLDPFKKQDGYGTFNLRGGVNFLSHRLEIAAWAKNLFDEDYYNVYFDVPLQSGKLNAYPTEPRTYGLSLNKHF